MDVHRDFCEVAVAERGQVSHRGRIETSTASLELFAGSLAPDDQVVLEATGPAFAIARILRSHVARVVVANAQEVRAISHARVKSDRFDAATLARLLSADLLAEVWVCDERIGALRRRLARRGALVRQRTRAKNEVHAVLSRCLLGRPPVSDLFGKAGRRWLAGHDLVEEEQETVEGCLRQIDFLDTEIALIDRKVAQFVLGSPDARRLMTVPGIDVVTAAALVAAIGDIARFASPRQLVAYLGLDPKVRQSGSEPARHGKISKRGDARARHVLVEAAWTATRSPGPLRAFGERIRARRGKQIAAVAVARKIATIAWHMLSKEEDYAFARPSLVRGKRAASSDSPTRRRAPWSTPATSADSPTRSACCSAKPSAATDGSSATGRPRRRVRARHRGAHLKGPRRAKQRGRPQSPRRLRFSSSVTRTQRPPLQSRPHLATALDFHP
ncbi:MAG: IS110 family transposase [Thermoleophilaceae bacterium]